MQTYWCVAITISLFVHGVVFALGMPGIFSHTLPTHETNKAVPVVKEVRIVPQKVTQSVPLLAHNAISAQGGGHGYLPPYVENLQNKLIMKNDTHVELEKATLAGKQASTVMISNIDATDILFLKNNPGYMSYYNAVSGKLSKIGRKFYTVKESGEVRLVFSISKKGEVLHAEAASDNPVLKDLALKIIQDASPFPALPSEFDRTSVSFSISMQFREQAH